MSKHVKTADHKPAIPKLVVTLQPEGWEALRLAREVSGIPARTIARRAIAAYIQQPIFRPPPGRTDGDKRQTGRLETAGQSQSRGIDRPRVPKGRRPKI